MINKLYKKLSERSAPALKFYMKRRLKLGKEDPDRINERYGIASHPRPSGSVVWIHAASVGEAQAGLILLNTINKSLKKQTSFLVTTGTRTSAQLMTDRLPDNAIHQYAVWDHPDWVRTFFDHWKPDIAFWMESELWPNTLRFLQKHHIPCALINARMSEKSFKNWSKAPNSAKTILSSFDTILCQTSEHQHYFKTLGGHNVEITGNLKYSATPLPYDEKELNALKKITKGRPVWLYASTHDGEETLACETHIQLKEKHPNLLTIIVPRHPERAKNILHDCHKYNLNIQQRSNKAPLDKKADIYLADTLGELGLFYALSEIAVIGRSFSNDGGGGHNPIEAALLDCAILTGPHYQNQQELFDGMNGKNACIIINEKQSLAPELQNLLSVPENRKELIKTGKGYASEKAIIINHVMEEIEPLFLKADMPYK